MFRKLVALILAVSFLALPHSYFVEASEEEETPAEETEKKDEKGTDS